MGPTVALTIVDAAEELLTKKGEEQMEESSLELWRMNESLKLPFQFFLHIADINMSYLIWLFTFEG